MDNPCIEWGKFRNPLGYGMVANGKGGSMLAHRKAWMEANGQIPDGMCVLHRCDNPPCINPLHLFLGTPLDNTRDMDKKGRGNRVKGTNHGMAKISDEDAIQIRQMKGHMTGVEVARLFGLKKSQVYNIMNYKSWSHLL